ncbi:hypothetical protein [Gymnodinialimonas ceratoperidinii]|uniref:Lipoprotein n=1 Tax=Gymnodinialimonas ceratoperidinii TaxID=2856823 RepID=A0A8F6U0A5_9RHOB|nr:hypothetical protein [Gymnodinialimonas ceratoperidinii]QXT41279.1 hypothetical protein KYE46_08735 [Gymnodinialimonas ceratoperidinii]
MTLRLTLLPLALLAVAACQPSYDAGETVTLAGGERCVVLGPAPEGTRLDCATRGEIIADLRPPDINAQLDPEIAPGVQLSDLPGVPSLPTIPQSEAEAACRASHYAENRVRGEVRGAVEGAVLEAAGLPGNTLGLIRRSQRIARRIEGRPAPASTPDPCDGL